jgi:hypothetical protein
VPAAAAAERERDGGGRGQRRRAAERAAEAPGAPPSAPLRERRGVELGREPRLEARGHVAGERPAAEPGERVLDGRQLVLGHAALAGRVVHDR